MHTCFPAPLVFCMAQEEKVARKTHTYNSPLCQQKAGPQENSAKGKRKTIRLPLPDREWWASQQRQKEVLCLASDVYKRPVFSHKSEEQQKWEEREEAGGEKQREGDIRRLTSAVAVSTLLAVFRSSDIQSAENSRETNHSRQKTEQLCCRGPQPATCLSFQ